MVLNALYCSGKTLNRKDLKQLMFLLKVLMQMQLRKAERKISEIFCLHQFGLLYVSFTLLYYFQEVLTSSIAPAEILCPATLITSSARDRTYK